MTTSFTLFGLTFHWYGLLIGIGIAVALQIAEWHLKKAGKDTSRFWESSLIVLVAGIVGGRLWHIATDWQLYVHNWLAAAYIWNGGMSILGGLLGGAVAAWLLVRQQFTRLAFFVFADALLIGVPFGQAIGRIGNWINQELYGAPTNLPWGIYIDLQHRLPEYVPFSHYHPLFAYEMIGVLLLGTFLWISSRRTTLFTLGTGMVTLSYFAVYSLLRFGLEFLRLQKSTIGATSWGVNQVIVGVVFVVSCFLLIYRYNNLKEKHET